MQESYIHIYSGDGKGKTTAAVGLALRARSRGLRVLFVQFMKRESGGEADLLEALSITVRRFNNVLSPFFSPEADRGAIRLEARKALESVRRMLERFDMAVLDEFNVLLSEGILDKDEALRFLEGRNPGTELVLTGRGAPGWLIELADYATEMKAIKHPFPSSTKAREGIEF
jgi:cob(I)alamin adenosyltransferase